MFQAPLHQSASVDSHSAPLSFVVCFLSLLLLLCCGVYPVCYLPAWIEYLHVLLHVYIFIVSCSLCHFHRVLAESFSQPFLLVSFPLSWSSLGILLITFACASEASHLCHFSIDVLAFTVFAEQGFASSSADILNQVSSVFFFRKFPYSMWRKLRN